MDAPPLTEADASLGLCLIDGTWKYAQTMEKQLPSMQKRSLPNHFVTAYPRKQTGCIDPARGLASIEALFAAYTILKRPTAGLLDHFHWKEQFLALNIDFFPPVF
jgi:pre-rRNA-processing protein TSR3